MLRLAENSQNPAHYGRWRETACRRIRVTIALPTWLIRIVGNARKRKPLFEALVMDGCNQTPSWIAAHIGMDSVQQVLAFRYNELPPIREFAQRVGCTTISSVLRTAIIAALGMDVFRADLYTTTRNRENMAPPRLPLTQEEAQQTLERWRVPRKCGGANVYGKTVVRAKPVTAYAAEALL